MTGRDGDGGAGAVPAPPPRPVEESRTVEPEPFARHLWDLLSIHGPKTATDLRPLAVFPLGEPWREYVRWTEREPKKAPGPGELARADQHYLERAIDQGVRRGWFTCLDDGRVAPAECPPEWEPLRSTGGPEGVAKRLMSEDDAKALAILRRPTNPSRRKPLKRKVDELRESLKTYGQIHDIVGWHPMGQPSPIIVSGVTRMELLAEMGVEPRITLLPRETPATVVLGIRMSAELQNSTKDEAKEARDKYIAEMHALGFTQEGIGKVVGLTQKRVSQIVKELGKPGRRTVTDAEADEMLDLADAGWTIRDIAEDTGWRKTTVSEAIAKRRAVRDTSPTSVTDKPVEPKPAKRTKKAQIMAEAEAMGAKSGSKVYDTSKNAPSAKLAAKLEPTFIPKFTDRDTLRLVLEYAASLPALWQVVVDFMTTRGWTEP